MPYKKNSHKYRLLFGTLYLIGLLWDTFIKKFLRNYKKNFLATIEKTSLQL